MKTISFTIQVNHFEGLYLRPWIFSKDKKRDKRTSKRQLASRVISLTFQGCGGKQHSRFVPGSSPHTMRWPSGSRPRGPRSWPYGGKRSTCGRGGPPWILNMSGSWSRVGSRSSSSHPIEEPTTCRLVPCVIDFIVIIHVSYFIGLFDINCLVGDIILTVTFWAYVFLKKCLVVSCVLLASQMLDMHEKSYQIHITYC